MVRQILPDPTRHRLSLNSYSECSNLLDDAASNIIGITSIARIYTGATLLSAFSLFTSTDTWQTGESDA